MTRRMIFPLIFGLLGSSILIGLGHWQVQRLAWKQSLIAEIAAQIWAEPTTIPPQPTAAFHKYMAVTVVGTLTGPPQFMLTSRQFMGPGYRVIARLETDAGPILADLGFVRQADRDAIALDVVVRIVGNLHWPNEFDTKFTPEPDLNENLWFAREVDKMAAALNTSPVLVVVRNIDPPIDLVVPWPVSTELTNDHLQYAITWFSLAVLWFGMTLYLLWRIRRNTV